MDPETRFVAVASPDVNEPEWPLARLSQVKVAVAPAGVKMELGVLLAPTAASARVVALLSVMGPVPAASWELRMVRVPAFTSIPPPQFPLPVASVKPAAPRFTSLTLA